MTPAPAPRVKLEWEVWARDLDAGMAMVAAFEDRPSAERWAGTIVDEQGYGWSTIYAQVRGPEGFRKAFTFQADDSGYHVIAYELTPELEAPAAREGGAA